MEIITAFREIHRPVQVKIGKMVLYEIVERGDHSEMLVVVRTLSR